MTLPMEWLSPATLRLLALSLLHFLWQGAALAALAYVVIALCRSAAARYAVGVTTLGLMIAAPVGTFLVFRAQDQSAVTSATIPLATDTYGRTSASVWAPAQNPVKRQESVTPYSLWLVELWFAGVVLLSLRSAGGILLVERLRRKETMPLSQEVLEICEGLQRRMGLMRAIRYCESLRLNAPAVAGWIRPVVLLPVSALSGLTQAQLEAVIAHELAHIRRYDTLVNLFQVGVETLLFYHPAVWWLGSRVRAEREHCCDDAAVALCGSPVTYAHALTRMAESKSAPQLAMAANRSPLVERIARLLGANNKAESLRGANLSAGVLCLSAALLAGSALVGSVHQVQAQTPAPARAAETDAMVTGGEEYRGHVPVIPGAQESTQAGAPSPAPVATPAPVAKSAAVANPALVAKATPFVVAIPKASAPAGAQRFSWSFGSGMAHGYSVSIARTWAGSVVTFSQEKTGEAAVSAQGATNSPKQTYIDSMSAAGLTDLSADELISLKVQGVTADYIRSMKQYIKSSDGKIDVDTIIGLKVQGITGEYIKEMSAATGQNLGADDAIGMKVQGVTPEYVKEMHDLGLKTDADDIIGMKVQGVTPEYVKQMHDMGLRTDSDDIIGMKVQGISPEYVREMRGLGLKVDSDDLIGMKVQGVTPEYVKGFNDMGFHPSTDELIGMKVQGVTPAYLKDLQSAGFKVDVDDAIGAKVQGVTPEFIAKVKSHGFKDLTLDKLIALKESGVFDTEK
jgi:beta-lactamase regulating signal transducer with metallopeptidase domain